MTERSEGMRRYVPGGVGGRPPQGTRMTERIGAPAAVRRRLPQDTSVISEIE
jgi:hypothetical protein